MPISNRKDDYPAEPPPPLVPNSNHAESVVNGNIAAPVAAVFGGPIDDHSSATSTRTTMSHRVYNNLQSGIQALNPIQRMSLVLAQQQYDQERYRLELLQEAQRQQQLLMMNSSSSLMQENNARNILGSSLFNSSSPGNYASINIHSTEESPSSDMNINNLLPYTLNALSSVYPPSHLSLGTSLGNNRSLTHTTGQSIDAGSSHDIGLVVKKKRARKKRKKKEKGRPPRPLSAYNFFFKDERKTILADFSNLADTEDGKDDDRGGSTGEHAGGSGPIVAATPAGKPSIGFENLAKTIGRRWKEITPERLAHYKALAKTDQKRYVDEMKVYEEKLKQLWLEEEEQKLRTKKALEIMANKSMLDKDTAEIEGSEARHGIASNQSGVDLSEADFNVYSTEQPAKRPPRNEPTIHADCYEKESISRAVAGDDNLFFGFSSSADARVAPDAVGSPLKKKSRTQEYHQQASIENKKLLSVSGTFLPFSSQGPLQKNYPASDSVGFDRNNNNNKQRIPVVGRLQNNFVQQPSNLLQQLNDKESMLSATKQQSAPQQQLPSGQTYLPKVIDQNNNMISAIQQRQQITVPQHHTYQQQQNSEQMQRILNYVMLQPTNSSTSSSMRQHSNNHSHQGNNISCDVSNNVSPLLTDDYPKTGSREELILLETMMRNAAKTTSRGQMAIPNSTGSRNLVPQFSSMGLSHSQQQPFAMSTELYLSQLAAQQKQLLETRNLPSNTIVPPGSQLLNNYIAPTNGENAAERLFLHNRNQMQIRRNVLGQQHDHNLLLAPVNANHQRRATDHASLNSSGNGDNEDEEIVDDKNPKNSLR